MYSKSKANFLHQPPFYSTCHPTSLKPTTPMSNTSLLSYRSKSIVIPVESLTKSSSYNNSSASSPTSSSSPSKSYYWSWTFGLTTSFFIVWGCPFYLLTAKYPPNKPLIRTTGSWLKRIFDCGSFPLSAIFSCIPLAITTLVNIYFIYLFIALFNTFFISGTFKSEFFTDLLKFLSLFPVILPLNYVWFKGFKINNIICLLDEKHRKYPDVTTCASLPRTILMLLVVACIHTIRFLVYKKYTFENSKFSTILDNITSLSNDFFASLVLPVYCAFCYAIRYELLLIKAIIYKAVSKREIPSVYHLNTFKSLFTHAADHIITVNELFSFYMSLVLILLLIATCVDAAYLFQVSFGGAVSLFNGGTSIPKIAESFLEEFFSPQNSPFPNLQQTSTETPPYQTVTPLDESVDPSSVRRVSADIVCIILSYALIFFTVWQAVGTNDIVREVHVWLNDFSTGGGGTDVNSVLLNMGIINDNEIDITPTDSLKQPLDRHGEPKYPLIWGDNSSKQSDDELDEEFMKKFKLLKAYIHVRCELEKPALLTISLVGLLVPSLSGRLKRYNVLF